MRAALLHGRRDIRLSDLPEPPDDLQAHQVLVAPRWTGICGTDLHEYLHGPLQIAAAPRSATEAATPQILGHEFAGEVRAVGSRVISVAPGDRVSIMPLVFCGDCHYCHAGLEQLCPALACVGLHTPWGGFATQAVVEDYQVVAIPDGLSYEQGALIEPTAAAVNAVRRAGVAIGDTVLIAGAGPIGVLAALAARAAGAIDVFLSEPNAARAARVAALNIAPALDPRTTDVVGELRAATAGLGVDVAIECAGTLGALQTCLGATRRRGVVAQVGLFVEPVPIDVFDLASREVSLVGVWGYGPRDWSRVTALIASGAVPAERIVTSRIALEDIVDHGFEPLGDPAGQELKVLVDLSASPPMRRAKA